MFTANIEWWRPLVLILVSNVLVALLTFLHFRPRNRNIINLKSLFLDKDMDVVEEDKKVVASIPKGAKIVWDYTLKRICKRCRDGNIVARIRYRVLDVNKNRLECKPLTCFYYCNNCAFKGVHIGRKA